MLTYFHNGEQYPLENSDYYIRELANGLDEVIFSLDIHDPIYAILAEEENIVDRAGQTYKVKQIDAGAHDAKVICQLDIDEWRASLNVEYNSDTKTVLQQINAVKPAGWTVNDRSGSSIGRTLEGDLTPYDVCVECTNVYDVYIRWDTKRKECTIYPKAMKDPVGAFATRELNLKEINYKGKSNDLVTRLYCYGKDGLSFADINSGKPYVDNFTYENRIICGIWRDERYEVKENLLADAQKKLEQMSRPQRTYQCSIVDLQATNPELYNNLDFSLFTTATLIDDVKNTSIDYQVVERHIYPYHPDMNEVIFNSEPLKITASVTNIEYQMESPNSTFQQIQAQRIAAATNWLLSGDGYVVAIKGSNDEWKELLFMDTDDIATAQKVLRINENGIGFSTTGAEGPYTNAWTIDGQLLADFITTGTLNANLVDVIGKIQATSGYFGTSDAVGWNIGNNNIHSKNGPTTISDTTHAGMYVGVDGLRTNGSNGETTKISGGNIQSNQNIQAQGFYTPLGSVANISAFNGGTVQAAHYQSGDGSEGVTKQITWVYNGTGYSINVKNGIVVGMVGN